MFPSALGGEPSSRRRGGSADGRAESWSLGEGLRAGLVGIPAPHTHMVPPGAGEAGLCLCVPRILGWSVELEAAHGQEG